MTQSSTIKSFLSYLLLISFLATPLSPTLAMIEGSSGGSTNSTPGTNNGGFAASESLEEEEEESEEEKDRRLAEETKAEIAAAVSAAGLDLEVGAVLGAEPSGSAVNVAGVSMGKEEALAAIDAMGAAKSVGAIGVVATEKTLEAYANGNACAGCVVGLNTATVGSPTEVAKAEADYVVSIAGVVGARLVNNISSAIAIKAADISSAIGTVAPQILPTPNAGKTKASIVPASVIAQYQEAQSGMLAAGVSNLGGTQIEKGYVYDNETKSLIGLTTGKKYEVSNIGLAASIPSVAEANPNAVVKIDTTNGIISATDVMTGMVASYDLEGDTLIPNYDIEAGLSWDGTAYGQYLLLSDSAGSGNYQVLNATAGTPSSWIATGNFDLGNVTAELQTLAIQHGYTIDSPEELVALALSGELSHETRRAIVEAYKEDPSFSTLDLTDISEVGGILGAFAGEAYRANRTLAEQLLVDKYVTSITYDPYNNKESAFDRYENDGEAMLALAEAYTSGQLTNKFGLKVTAPVEVANHTYASTYDPNNPNAKPLTAGNAWIAEVNENATSVGGRFYTEIGYITSELNNSSNWRGLMVDQNFNYDEEIYGSFNDNLYTLVTSVPNINVGVIDVGNKTGINLNSLLGSIKPSSGGTTSGNTNQNIQATNNGFTPISTQPSPSGNCSDCVKIESVTCKAANSCTVDSKYAIRLDFLAQNSDLSFRVTEGYPPTVNHANSCHSNGTCTDIGFTGVPYNSETVKQFIEDAKKAGLKAVFESVTSEGCEGIEENCTVVSWATASHFSLYMGENEPNFGTANNSVSTPSSPSLFDQLGGALGEGIDAALGAANDVINSEAVQELDKAMDNPLFGLYMWAVNTFGGNGGGNLNNFPSENNNNSGSENNIPPCPLNPGEPDPYKEWRMQNGYPLCTATSTNNQAGAVYTPFLDSNFVQYLLSLFGWHKSEDISTLESSVVTEPEIATIKITVDDTNKVVALSRPDWEAIITDQSIDASERATLLEKLKETPVIFDEAGEVIYSNGVYTPPVENGREVTTNQVYSYIVEYIDANGDVIPAITNEKVVSDNIISDALSSLFGENTPFTIGDVKNISYHLIDPDNSIASDEYYQYAITTLDGKSRTIDVPHFTSVNYMEERFQKIGYRGEVLALTALATEKQPEPSTLSKISGFVNDLVGKFVDALNGNSADTKEDLHTILPEVSNDLSEKNIQNINIYPNSTIACPDIVGQNQGFMYTAVLTDTANPQKYITITDGRCGSTDPLMMISETARHLQEYYGLQEISYETLAAKTTLHNKMAAFIPGVNSKIIGTTVSETNESPDLSTGIENPDTTSTTTPTQSPNLTNEIVFEVKAVGSDGKLLADWIETEEITISEGVNLHFRWDGSSYQQCLAFLNDNGNYSLTRSNRAMVTGNTEEEHYDVTERSATYKMECGGQRNNEFGVDAREIKVLVQ